MLGSGCAALAVRDRSSLRGWLSLAGVGVSRVKREGIELLPGVFDILLSGTLVMSLITIPKSTMGWEAKGRNK